MEATPQLLDFALVNAVNAPQPLPLIQRMFDQHEQQVKQMPARQSRQADQAEKMMRPTFSFD